MKFGLIFVYTHESTKSRTVNVSMRPISFLVPVTPLALTCLPNFG